MNSESMYGKRLADFLVVGLRARGFDVADAFPEDWGWLLEVRGAPFPMMVGCANVGEDEFVCFVDPDRPGIRRWFRSFDTAPFVNPLRDALAEMLRQHPEVRELQWE